MKKLGESRSLEKDKVRKRKGTGHAVSGSKDRNKRCDRRTKMGRDPGRKKSL